MNFKLIKDQDDTFVLDPLPENYELEEFYKKKYFQQSSQAKGPYKINYSKQELANINLFSIITEFCIKKSGLEDHKSLIDIGCGEGYISRYFSEKGYKVTAADFSSYGIESRNPKLLNNIELIQCDITSKHLLNTNCKFPIIICRGVMEHVRDIDSLIRNFQSILKDFGIIIILVPNDRSLLIDKYRKRIGKSFINCLPYCPPEHIRYFSHNSIEKLMKRFGFIRILPRMATLPVEAFLLNENTDYYSNKDKGKIAHDIRCQIAEGIYKSEPDKIFNLSISLGELNIGRDIIHCYTKRN